MALVHDEMRRTYAAQRGVSQGVHITLTATAYGYQARFECAKRAAEILGTRNLAEHGLNGESIPLLTIPMEEVHRAITKLAESYSVALVDTVTDEHGTRFVLVWRIAPTRVPTPKEVIDAFAVTANQGKTDDLDEY